MKPIIKLKSTLKKLPVILIILLLILLIFSCITIRERLVTKMREELITIVHDLSEQQNNIVSYNVDAWYRYANTIADFCTDNTGLNADKIKSILKTVNKSVNQKVLIVDENGNGFDYQKNYSISDRNYFKEIKDGKNTISDVLRSKHNGQNVIVVAVPIKLGNRIVGGVICTYLTKDLESLFYNETLASFGNTLIIQKDGTIVVGNETYQTSKSFYNNERIKKIMGYNNFQLFKESILNNKHGHFQYKQTGKTKYLCYETNEKTDWIVVTLVDEEALGTHINAMTNGTITYIYIIIICITLLFLFILALYIVVFRLLRRNSQALLVEKERFQMITEQTEDVIFDYNIESKVLYFSNNFKNEYGVNPPDNIDEIQDLIASDNLILFTEKIDELLSGRPMIKLELKLKNHTGSFEWYHLSASMMYDKVHSHRVIGRLQNIHDEKVKMKLLTNMAELDPLTKLLNKGGVIQHINTFLAEKGKDSKHAYFFVDIDNFKTVNDTFGHQEGDNLLSMISTTIKSHFHKKDIIGRFGGDEFIILMKNYIDEANVAYIANRLCKSLLEKSLEHNYHFSASIGIALYPKDGINQRDLMKKADVALYEAKKLGKNQFHFYEST